MKRITRSRPSPAVLVAVAALVAALAGTAAAGPTAHTSASAKKTAKKALKKAKSAQAAADGAQGTADGAKGTANQALGDAGAAQDTADAATPLTAAVTQGGTLVRGEGSTSVVKGGAGVYQVVFNRPMAGCTWVATLGTVDNTGVSAPGQIDTALGTSPNRVFVHTSDSAGVDANRDFQLQVHCAP